MCRTANLSLPTRAQSVSAGRHFVGETLVGWGISEGDPAWAVLADTLLVVTELLADAVISSDGSVRLDVTGHRSRLRLSVRGDGPVHSGPLASPPDDDGRRGLVIVETLSDRWGHSAATGGREVWAEIAIGPGSVLAQGCTE